MLGMLRVAVPSYRWPTGLYQRDIEQTMRTASPRAMKQHHMLSRGWMCNLQASSRAGPTIGAKVQWDRRNAQSATCATQHQSDKYASKPRQVSAPVVCKPLAELIPCVVTPATNCSDTESAACSKIRNDEYCSKLARHRSEYTDYPPSMKGHTVNSTELCGSSDSPSRSELPNSASSSVWESSFSPFDAMTVSCNDR